MSLQEQLTYQVLEFSLQHSLGFAVLHSDYILWDEPVYLFFLNEHI